MPPDRTSARPASVGTAAVAPHDADLVIVGGGLAGGLIAWRLHQRCPRLRLCVLERESTLGGNHTWSFHESDLTAGQAAWLAPLVAHRWPAYEVAFPRLRRRLAGGYASITSARFDAVLRPALGDAVRTEVHVAALTPRSVTLADGRRLHARAVIDARGPRHSPHLALGFQKFLGQELELAAPHGLALPLLMDATVAQADGYRFVYVLPLGSHTLLVEDTYYADGQALDAQALRQRIAAYAGQRGWTVRRVLREEQGVLPIVLDGDLHAHWQAAAGVPLAGLAGVHFHPTTGYSLPDACAVADRLADVTARWVDRAAATRGTERSTGAVPHSVARDDRPPGCPGSAAEEPLASLLFETLRADGAACWSDRRFYRALNRMLFLSAQPSRRWQVMQRFYGLPAPLIARFYAARLTPLDKLRIVSGRPPVPLAAAARAVLGGVAPAASGGGVAS